MARRKPDVPWADFHVRVPEPTYRVLEIMAHRQGMSMPAFMRTLCETIAAQAPELMPTLDAVEAGRTAEVLERYRAVSGRIESEVKVAMEPLEKRREGEGDGG